MSGGTLYTSAKRPGGQILGGTLCATTPGIDSFQITADCMNPSTCSDGNVSFSLYPAAQNDSAHAFTRSPSHLSASKEHC